MKDTETKKRIFYIEILRCIACLAVVMLHSSGYYFTWCPIDSTDFVISNFFDSVVRFSVPLFVMISGALMLDENYDFSTKKQLGHIGKMMAFFIFWSALYSIADNAFLPLINGNKIVIKDIILSFISGPSHFWYVFMIIGFYLLLPLLRIWIKKENKKYIEYFICVSVIFLFVLPQLFELGGKFFEIFDYFALAVYKLHLDYIGGYTVYFILGWYLKTFEIKNIRSIVVGGIAGIFVSFLVSHFVSVYKGGVRYTFYSNLSLHVMITAVMIFVLLKNANIEYNEHKPLHRIINFISKYSLGIYAIHLYVVGYSAALAQNIGIESAVFKIPFVFAVSASVGLLLSFIIGRIPLLKKLV